MTTRFSGIDVIYKYALHMYTYRQSINEMFYITLEPNSVLEKKPYYLKS